MDNKLKLEDKLRTSGLRPTRQRVKIAELLFDREKTFHFTVEDLGRLINLKNNREKISLATFYNTVHAFKKAGHVKEIITNSNKNYFDTNISSHHHFFDSKNNKLTDIELKEVELGKIPNAPEGKFIRDIEVIINVESKKNNPS